MAKSKGKRKTKSASLKKSKLKKKPKSRAQTRSKKTASNRLKSKKLKAKPRKAKSKAKTTAKKKYKTKTKTKSKPKAKMKKRASSKPKAKKQAKTKTTENLSFTEEQKERLLDGVRRIIDLRRNTVYGLRSLDALDHILDQYNQKYTDTHAKFAAIIDHAITEHDNYVGNTGLIAFKDTGNDSVALYRLLARIGKGNTDFSEANEEINTIYEDSLNNGS